MGKTVQIAKVYTFCHIKCLWKQNSSQTLITSVWCVNFLYFFCVPKFDFDLDPELSEKSDPDPEIIFSDTTHCYRGRVNMSIHETFTMTIGQPIGSDDSKPTKIEICMARPVDLDPQHCQKEV